MSIKTVQKFSSFEELKSMDKKVTDYKSRVKKHNDFERVVREIYCAKDQIKHDSKSE